MLRRRSSTKNNSELKTMSGMETTPASNRVIAHMAEYQAVMGEIANRTSAQHVLMNIALTFAAAVGGFALVNPGQSIVALVIPFAGSALGAVWLDHARQITKIGNYVSFALWPQIREALDFRELSSHEDWVRIQDQNRSAWLVFVVPLTLIFVFPAYVSLVYSFEAAIERDLRILWASAATVTVLSTAYWIAYYLDHTVLTKMGHPYKPELWGPSK